MACMCGDSQCPSCGLAQGTLEPELEFCEWCGLEGAEFHDDYRVHLHPECVDGWLADQNASRADAVADAHQEGL